MKNQVSKSKSLFISLLLIIGISFSLSAQEVKKEISESYKLTKDFTLGIENKYGNINIINWDKSEAEVKVEIVVKAASETKAQKILDKIDIDINKLANGVDFVTQIKISNYGKNISVEVNYQVNAPASINVNLTQKYGDIFLEELTGDANIIVKYGGLKAQSLANAKGKANDLVMAYSEGVIKSCGKINAKLAYSEIKFGVVESYEGKLAYSEFKALNLKSNLVLSAAYSEVEIENVAAGFETVDISATYGDIKVLMDSNAAYSYELLTKFGSLDAPKGSVTMEEYKNDGHGPNFYESGKGSVGNSAGGKVTVTAKYGDITVY